MKRETKRQPSDYPQFSFRVSKEDKEKLTDLVEEVRQIYNADLAENEKLHNKNDIIIMALEKGLSLMRKRKN